MCMVMFFICIYEIGFYNVMCCCVVYEYVLLYLFVNEFIGYCLILVYISLYFVKWEIYFKLLLMLLFLGFI